MFKSNIHRIFLVSFFLALTACSHLQPEPKPVALQNNFYTLQPVPSLLQKQIFVESLTFNNEKSRQLLTQIETTESSLNLAAVTFSGMAVVQAQWQQEQGLINFSSPVFDKNMILRIIRDIQLVKWPKESISAGLALNTTLFSGQDDNQNPMRAIKNAEQTLVKITYYNQQIKLQNFIDNYEFVIEPIDE